ncbi:MAG: hypothetical protein IIC82_05375 [Chloroflexi bacterium]|nr:hypothetical protein [Chloroflexota bacterium]
MKVRALEHCDAQLSEQNKLALFEGQDYDLPVPVARELIADGKVAEVKSVSGPPEDKAGGRRRRNK